MGAGEAMADRGRPVTYTRDVADVICDRLADGMTLREICRGDGMPPESTVRMWATDDRDGFAARYARARELGYQAMADELMEIADDGTNDWMKRQMQDGSTGDVENHEALARSRLRVDTRKWMLSKVLPKVYGDKLDLSSTDGTMTPAPALDVSKLSTDALAEIMQAMDAAKRG